MFTMSLLLYECSYTTQTQWNNICVTDDVVPGPQSMLESHWVILLLAQAKAYVAMGTPLRGVQPVAHGPHAAQDGYEWGPTQNREFT